MSIKGLEQFTASIRGFQNSIPKIHSDLCKNIASKLAEEIILNTPVDTGEARGEWQQTEGEPANTPTNVLDKDGHPTLAKCKSVIERSDPSRNVLWLSNRSDHIEVLEDGHSKTQAPAGMVEIALLNVKVFGVK